MRFSEIPGLEESKRQLIHAITSNHVAHAQLFYGQEGSANLALALAYTAYINCHDRSAVDSCGICPSCTKIDKLIHPDLQFIYPVASTKSITGKDVVSTSYLKDWRTYLPQNIYGSLQNWNAHYGAENKQPNISKEDSRNIIKSLSLKSFEAEYKVMIIWLPELMHSSAANAILKILEEPPAKTLFLMVTCEYERLLTTILSRCQLFKVPSFSVDEIKTYLIKTHQIEGQKANKLANLAEGSIRKAIDSMDTAEDDSQAMFRTWMRQCFTRDYTAIYKTSESFASMSKTSQKVFLQYALNMMRHALVSTFMMDEKLRLNPDEQDFVTKFGRALNSQKIEGISNEFNKAQYHLERNANVRIVFMDMSLTVGKTMTA